MNLSNRHEENRIILKLIRSIETHEWKTDFVVIPVPLTHDGRFGLLFQYVMLRKGYRLTLRFKYDTHALINIERRNSQNLLTV